MNWLGTVEDRTPDSCVNRLFYLTPWTNLQICTAAAAQELMLQQSKSLIEIYELASLFPSELLSVWWAWERKAPKKNEDRHWGEKRLHLQSTGEEEREVDGKTARVIHITSTTKQNTPVHSS